jgi:hypothetical protein
MKKIGGRKSRDTVPLSLRPSQRYGSRSGSTRIHHLLSNPNPDTKFEVLDQDLAPEQEWTSTFKKSSKNWQCDLKSHKMTFKIIHIAKKYIRGGS